MKGKLSYELYPMKSVIPLCEKSTIKIIASLSHIKVVVLIFVLSPGFPESLRLCFFKILYTGVLERIIMFIFDTLGYNTVVTVETFDLLCQRSMVSMVTTVLYPRVSNINIHPSTPFPTV